MKIYSIIFFMLFVGFQYVDIQGQEISYHHLSTKENLSHYSVMSVYQDCFGQMWIGTRNGLNLYNGNEIQIFKYDKDKENSIVCNSIRDITGSPDGQIYILTVRGISEYDNKKAKFTTLTTNAVSAIYYWNNLYIALENSIYFYDKENFRLVYTLPNKDFHITSLYIDSSQILMGTHENGLYRYDRNKKVLSLLFGKDEVTNIFKDSKNRFWVGTISSGLYVVVDDKLLHYEAGEDSSSSLCANYIRDFCEDKSGNIWIGTFRGLNKYIPHLDSFQSYPNTSREIMGPSSSIWSLFCDNQGNVWAGTYFGGVDYFNPTQDIYSCYNVSLHPNEGLSAPIVGAMTEDLNHNLWICTEGGGLNCLNLINGKFEWYKHSFASGSISQNNLKSVYFDKERQCLWIGAHMGGLNRMNLKTGKFSHYLNNRLFSHKSNIVCDIIPYRDNLLLATHDGIYMFNPEKETFKPLFKDRKDGNDINFALDLCLDHNGILWIAGAEKGAYSYDFVTDRLKLYSHKTEDKHSISSNGINCIYEDNNHNLWLCTAETGIDLYRHQTDDFENINESNNGLISNCIYGMCSVEPDALLISTDCGFSYMDVKNRKINNYAVNKNIPLSAINQNSICRTSDGKIFVGGVDGMVSFFPQKLNQKSLPYSIFPSKLFVNDKEVTIGDETGILTKSLYMTDCLTFSSSQSMFSIQYAVTNYFASNQDEIQYCLENFSDTWSTLRKGHMITYTNLAPGDYRLVVRSINVDGTENTSNVIKIVVLPPIYKSWWAYIIYILAFVLSLAYFVRAYYRKLKLQAELKYEKNYNKNIEELNQSKLRFFTNISHEFCTPLTLIVGQMEMLLQNKSLPSMVYNKILRTYKNCIQLHELITELIDFRKQEQGKMKIKVSEHNIVDFLYDTFRLFQDYANTKHVTFRFNKTTDTIKVWYDPIQLQKVINNILLNAFQFVPEYGEVSLSIAKHGSKVIVDVSDNGPGIALEEQDKIFNMFYQASSNVDSGKPRSGIGLALAKGIIEMHHGDISVASELGEGATFTFTLSTGKDHFSDDEIAVLDNNQNYVIHNDLEYLEKIIPENENEDETDDVDEERKFSVLVAEEDEALRQMLQELFRPYYSVVVVPDGKQALSSVRNKLPDLIVSDTMLSGMSGIELCKNIKNNLETCHIPIILLTAHTASENQKEGIMIGADDYIVKPFDIDILLAKCKNLINTRIVLQEKFSRQPNSTVQVMATNTFDKQFVDKLIGIVEKHLDDVDFNINVFAQEVGFARTKLFSKLKSVTGQTPNEFIMTVRLRKSVELLREKPEYNVTNISTMCGFSNQRYFSHCFKEKFGMTPQQYRRGDFYIER